MLPHDIKIFVVTYYKFDKNGVVLLKNVATYYIRKENYGFMRDFVVGRFMQTWKIGIKFSVASSDTFSGERFGSEHLRYWIF